MTVLPASSSTSLPSAPSGVLDLLRGGEFLPLDAQLQQLQARFEAGELDEHELLAAFLPFEASDTALGEHFGGWMEAVPGSYVAHVALATWMLARAWSYRGGTTYDKVSDRGRRGMAHFLEQAEACARHATGLTANPLAAWHVVARVAMTQGNRLTLPQVEAGEWPDWYARPLDANPDSLQLRRDMLLYLRTEWGGSDAMMLSFLRAQDGQLSNQSRQRLWSQYHTQVSHHALAFAQDEPLALEHARMAADLHPAGSTQLLTVLMALPAMRASANAKRAAFERVLAYLEGTPEASVHGNTGWALNRYLNRSVGRDRADVARTAAVMLRLARAGDHDALVLLGQLAAAHKAAPTPALEQARPMLMQAAQRGDARAAALLAGYHRAAPADPVARNAALLMGANLADPDCAWDIYTSWARFEGKHGLTARDKLRFLLLAADNGNNDARVTLAGLLRSGQAEVGEDGVLRPIAGRPIQASLDYAKHLLERAAHEGQDDAAQQLRQARDRDWQEGTARVQPLRAASRSVAGWRLAPESSWRWWLAFMGVVALLRACVPH